MRRVLALVALVALTAFSSTAASAGPSQSVDPEPDQSEEAEATDRPVEEAKERGFVPAMDGENPALPFPGMTKAEAEKARADLAVFDAAESEAMMEADRLFARRDDGSTEPIAPSGPEVPIGRGGKPDVSRVLPHLPPGESGSVSLQQGGPSSAAASSCTGNCYQTDRIWLSDPSNTIYASEYQIWLAIPQNWEWNRCDSTTSPDGCFWFYAIQHNTDSNTNAGFHIGPQRGSSLAGAAGANWRMNIDGYINGVHLGGQSSVNLPVATWIRVRTWRLGTGNDPFAPYTPWATWGVWAMWGGTDHYLGSLTIDGHYLVDGMLFSEVYESQQQCATDLERGYFNDAHYWDWSASQAAFADGWANYEANCSNTTWEHYGGDFVKDERDTTRVVAEGTQLW